MSTHTHTIVADELHRWNQSICLQVFSLLLPLARWILMYMCTTYVYEHLSRMCSVQVLTFCHIQATEFLQQILYDRHFSNDAGITLSWFVGVSRMTWLIHTCGMSCVHVWNDPSESICTKHEKFPRCARLHGSFCCGDSWCNFVTTLIHIAFPAFFLSTLLWLFSRFSLSSLFLTLFSNLGLPFSLSQTCMHG